MPNTCFLLLISVLMWLPGQAQVNADFSASNTQGCGSLQVNFEDQSTSSAGPIVSWSWDLGGVVSSNSNPGRIFGSPGRYTICLTATDSQGNSDTECKDEFITVFQLPQPGIQTDQNSGCSPLTITFTDASTSEDGMITDWIWGVGGTAGVVNQSGTSSSFTSTYNLTDSFSVNLTVIDENGCQATLTESDFITVLPDPVVDVSADALFSCTTPFEVNFTNNDIAPQTQYSWDFGNGATFDGAIPPTITYDQVGTYTVRVIAELENSGCRDTLLLENYIQLGNAVSITANLEEACVGEPIAFSLQASETDSVRWAFGDGMESTQLNPSHSFDAPGCYLVSVMHYLDGCETIISSPNCIDVFPLPVASGTADAPLGCVLPHTVNFEAFSFGNNILTWNFGDGTSSNESNPTHVYDAFGTYVVTLEAESANGCVEIFTVDTIQVEPLIPQLDVPLLGGCVPYTVDLNENSSSLSPIVSWEWLIDTTGTDWSTPYRTFSGPNPSFELIDTGTYDLILTVTNELGCMSSDTFPAQISGGAPVLVDFEADPLITCVESAIQFTDLSSDFVDQWFWDFGDGTNSMLSNPEHEYTDTGFFNVTLLGFYNGCASDTTYADLIYIQPPIAAFRLQRDCDRPFEVQVDDRSIGADSTFYYFDFNGDLSFNSAEAEPLITYPDTGQYIIIQVVENFETGCVDTSRANVYITDPDASFTLDPLEGCVPLEVQLTDDSDFAVSYAWSTGGGTLSNDSIANPMLTFTETGTYSDIQLIITDVNDCQDTALFTGDIRVNGVEVDFTALPIGGCRPLEVGFNALVSSTFGDIVSIEWDFGGVGASDEASPQFVFTEEGIYDIQLTVTDSWGCVGTEIKTEYIEVTQPAPLFSTLDTISCTKGVVQFESQSLGDNLNYLWDFGDGTGSTESDPQHTYMQEGVYDVCLTLSNTFGCDSTLCKVAYVTVADPVAAFQADTTAANCPPLLVNFSNQSQNAIEYSWNFGNNSGLSDQENPSVIYTEPGVFDVTLIAAATDQCQDTLTIPDYIQLAGPTGSFEFEYDDFCAPAPVTFIARTAEPYTLIWDFGNGDLDTTFNSASDSLMYVYPQEGRYVPKLILIDSDDCRFTLESPDTIELGVLAVDFLASDTLFCDRNEPVSFFNLTNSSDPVTNLLWSFEGGNPENSDQLEPEVSYMGSGMYGVKLLVETALCVDSLVRPDFIKIGANPFAAFELDQPEACVPSTLSFTDQSTVADGQVTQWSWSFGDQGNSTVQNPSHLYQTADTFTVTLVAASDMGCVDTTSTDVIIRPLPEVEVSGDTIICTGTSVGLDASFVPDTTAGFFIWQGPDLSCTNCPEPIARPLSTASYLLIGIDAFGCRDSASLTVTVRPDVAPEITVSADTSVCADGVVQLEVSGGVDLFSYQWDTTRLGLSCYTHCFNPLASPDTSTYFVVEVSNGLCSTIDSVLVEVVDDFFEFAGTDRTICQGDSVRLLAGQVQDPFWVVSTGLDCARCVAPMASPDTTTQYIVQAFSTAGCPIADSLTVTVKGSADIDAGSDTTICLGNEVLLSGFGEGEVAWSPSADLGDSTLLQTLTTPQESTTYTLSLTEDLCVLMDSLQVTVVEKTNIDLEDASICLGDTLILVVEGEADFFDWTLDEEPLSQTTAFLELTPTADQEIQVIAAQSGCAPDTAFAQITVEESPQVQSEETLQFFPGNSIDLMPLITGGSGDYTFEWSPATGLSCTNCPNPTATPDTNTVYQLLIQDMETGCISRWEVELRQLETCTDELLFVPNAFSPNGDGVNDFFRLFSSSILEINYLRIFDRWGGLVFETTDIDEGWDGTYKGQRLPSGVYVYVLEAPCPIDPNRVLRKSGDVSLVR